MPVADFELYRPTKPSRPSVARLHVTKRDELLALSEAVRIAEWMDAKNTHNDPALISVPVVEFSIYKKVPSDKKRTDGRQGTIDQDPDFMAFLEGLANPDTGKEAENTDHTVEENTKGEKPSTTPLIEHLRERAAKAKEAAAAKNAKHARQDSHSGKGKAAALALEEPKKKSREFKSEKTAEKSTGKVSEKPKESVKILSKRAAAETTVEAAKTAASQVQSAMASTPSEGPPKSRRAGIAAAARILQRDLGLSPGNAHRKARQDAAKAEAEAKASASKEPAKETPVAVQEPTTPSSPVDPSPSTSSATVKTQAGSRRSRGKNRGAAGEDGHKAKSDVKTDPEVEKAGELSSLSSVPAKPAIILMRKKDERKENAPTSSTPPAPTASASTPAPPTTSKPATTKQSASTKKGSSGGSAPTPGATRAFIKHANQSQGVTEPLLREAMEAFGSVTTIEMDRKKGFAYVDFAESEGLAKAMAASPVSVAQTSVQVVERKEVGNKKKETGKELVKNAGGSGGSSATPATAVPSESSTAAAAIATAAEKSGGDKHRGGRRRGGRGRGDKEPKEGFSSAGGASKGGDSQETTAA